VTDTLLIIGLGNPGARYDGTRHNVGFAFVDYALPKLASTTVSWKTEKRWQTEIAHINIKTNKVIALKPLTFMNLSGQAVSAVTQYYDVPPAHVLVVVDDINLPFGRMRYRPGGSAGGHNGLKSIQQSLATADYPRLRIGVGVQRTQQALTDHVLGKFATEEQALLPKVFEQACTVVDQWIGFTQSLAQNPANTIALNTLMANCNGWQLVTPTPATPTPLDGPV
jgi:peptidyl-tRNA hydrolase, PTH1 family